MEMLSNSKPGAGRKIRCRYCGDYFNTRKQANYHAPKCLKVLRGELSELPKQSIRSSKPKKNQAPDTQLGMAKHVRAKGATSVYRNQVVVDDENNKTVDLFVFDEMLDIDSEDFF